MKCLFEMSAVSLAVLFLVAATDGASVAPSNGDNVTESLRYLDHANATQLMRRWVRDHPGLAALYEVGRSVQGRELWVLKVAADVAGPRPVGRPMFKWVANMHGDEAVGRVVVLAMAEYLLKNYPADPEVKALLESVEFHLMPSMNPDGFDFSLRDDFKAEGGCSSRQGRRNTNGVDLNRNFPSQWRSYRNLSESREPETVAVMKWILENPFVLSGNMHGGSVVASYPFDDSKHHLVSGYYSKCPDDEFFRDVALTYASKHDIMKTGVPSCPGSELETFKYGITNGAHWYDVEGGMQDFNYVHSNCFEMTFELTCCKFPPEQTMKAEWLLNKRPMLDYMKKIHMGVKGVVTDGRSGKPVNRAVIVIQNIDKNVTTTERGEFWRLLVPGTYVVTVAANGYELETTEVTVPKEGYPVVRDFSLTPIGKREPSDASATYAVVNSTAAATSLVGHRQANTFVSGPAAGAAAAADDLTQLEVLQFSGHDWTAMGFQTPPNFVHHDYEAMEAFLQYYADRYPHVCRLYSIGKSVEGRELYAMEISDRPGEAELGEPEVKLVANIHGDEAVGKELLLTLIQLLVEGYGNHGGAPAVGRSASDHHHNNHHHHHNNNPSSRNRPQPSSVVSAHADVAVAARVERRRITQLVDSTRLHILPSMNPDGYERAYVSRGRRRLPGRGNAHGVDLNRDFLSGGEFPPSEPETRAMMDWSGAHSFVLSATFGGGGRGAVADNPFDICKECVDWPEGAAGTLDEFVFKRLAASYSQHHPRMMRFGSSCSKERDILLGGGMRHLGNHWGRTGGSDGDKDGSMVDWSFHQMGTFELAVQVSCVKFPDDTDLASYWLDNHNSLLSFISQVHVSSISGVVTSKSGVPVPSPFVSVSGTAKAVNGTVRGDFRRLLVPGTYEVTVSGADFVPQTVRNVTVAPAGSQPSYPPPTHLNVTLWRPSEVVAQRTAVQRISRGYDAGGGYYGSGYDRGGSGGGNVGGGGDEVEESRRPRRHVGLGAAGDVPDDGQSSSWIDREDFGIVENNVDRPERYLSRSQVIAAMSELEDRFSGVVEFLDGESDWSSPLRAIRLSASGKSHKRRLANVVRVALLSFHPMATDNLIRLARHLVVGNAGEDPASQRILRRADVYLVPVGYRVDDVPPSLAHSSTRCGRENVPATETLAFNPRTTEADPKISAIVHWLRAERMDVVFTIDGGGNFVRLATDVSPEHPDMQAEFLGVRLKTATALTASDVDYNRPCFREDAVDSLLTPIPGPSSGFPVFFTAHPYKYKDTLVDYITTALRTPSLDVRFACCEGETPSTAWRRTLPVLKSLLVGTTFHATGTVRILGGEPLRRGKFVLQGAEKRNINLDDEAGRYLVMLPPGPYVALISTEGHEPEPVRFSVLQHVDPVSQDLQLTKMRHTNWFRRWTNTSLNQVGSEGERPGVGADHNNTTVNNNNNSSSSISSPSSNNNGHNDIVSIMGDNHNPLGMSAGKVMGVNHGLDRSFVGSGMESHFNGRHQHHNGDPVMHAANVTGHNTNNHLNLMFNGNNLMGGDQGEGGHLLMHNPFGDLTGNRVNKNNNTRDQHVPKGALEEGTNSGSGEMFTTGISDFGKDGSAHSGIEHSDAPATLMPTTTASFLKKMPRGQVGEEQYHDIAEMEKYLADIARAFPHVVKLHIIGQSVQGRNLFMVEISQDVWMPLPGRPSVAIFAGFHGNHHSGPELVLDFVDDIIQHLNGTRVQKVLKRLRIFAMPVVNPDAYGGGKPESSRFCDRLGGDWTNKNGVDLALDYSGEIGEVETEALKRFFDAQPLTASVLYEGNLHEGVIAYPWFDKDAEPSGSVETPDSESFRWLTSAYKHKLDDEELSEYFQGTFNVLCPPLPEDVLDKGYAPAAAIAPQQGSVQDYLYKKYGALQLTVYLGCCGAPSYGAHMALWRKHRPALFHFLTTTTRHGIKGFVTKASTNEAIRGAVVSVETGDTRWTSTSRDQGQFFRLVAPNVTSAKVFVSADGFFPARKEFFLLEDELTAMKAALDEIKLPPVSMPQLPPQQPAAAVPANGPAPSPPMMITASPPVVTMRDFAANNNNVNSGGDSASTASSSMMSTVTTAQPSSSTAGDGQNRPARKIDGLATFRRKRADRK